MTDILLENLAVIQKRWPEIRRRIEQSSLQSLTVTVEQNTLLINDIQLTSNYNRAAEAEIQAQRIPINSPQAFVYGVGLGDVPDNLLKREALQSLVICILNLDLFLHTLNAIDHTSWLLDPRTQLMTSDQLTDVQQPFLALPTELIFCDDQSAILRDRIMLELDHDFIMSHHHENNKLAVSEVAANQSLLTLDSSVKSLFNTLHGRVYIAAAGPTLSKHYDKLRKIRQDDENSIIIALDACVKALLSENISPDYIVSIDARSAQIFDGVDIKKYLTGIPLIYFPRLDHVFLSQWPGKRFCSYSDSELYHEYKKHYPGASLFTGGSVIHPAVDLAVKMGASEVVLLGADFGFPDNKTYVSGQDYDYTQQFLSSSHWVINGKGEKITTMLNYRGYLRDLERYIETKPHINFLNGSDEGAKIAGTTLL